MGRFTFIYLIYSLALLFAANGYIVMSQYPVTAFLAIAVLLFICIFSGTSLHTDKTVLKICNHGKTMLCIFSLCLVPSMIYHILLLFFTMPEKWSLFVWSAVISVSVHAVVFWIGIICVYCTSVQLGIKHRVLGIICGMIPVLNIIMLMRIIKVVSAEIDFETGKEALNRSRKADKQCDTKYPILLVHGVFFRDSKYLNYWGRIPKELETNGAEVYYGNHQSALSVADSARELADRIKEITRQTGFEKLNIIAHSKGGLDCRYAIDKLGIAPLVASLTTINTPHRGCGFADYLLARCPEDFKNKVADTYNSALKKLGDTSPDFLAAVSDLTASAAESFNLEITDTHGIFCQSIGSVLNKASSGKFPLNLSYHLVKYFDGANDGLVSESSFCWGDDYTLVTTDSSRGISHGDMIDLNRENIPDFDVREFYVQLVHRLKEKGL